MFDLVSYICFKIFFWNIASENEKKFQIILQIYVLNKVGD
jgi:hypothetical protein